MYHLFLALHIIGVVAWFAGLFYLVRLLVNHSEVVANNQDGKEYIVPQLILMTTRLHRIIALPAAVFTLVTGGVLMVLTRAYHFPWFHLKVALVLGLITYHYYGYRLTKKFQLSSYANPPPKSGRFLRYYNELATVFLVAIVFLVVMKDVASALIAWGGFVAFLIVFMLLFQRLKRG